MSPFYFLRKLLFDKIQKIKGCGVISKIYISAAFFYLLLLSPEDIFSQTSGGGYSESYLLGNVGSRALALAGAYTAVSNEPMAIFYNPSGLGVLSTKPSVSTMYSFLEYGRSHTAIAWGQRFTDNLGFGFGINNYNGGTFMSRDIRGNPLGELSDRQFELIGGASYSMEFASVGVGIKYLLDALQGSGTRADGFSVDIGTKFNIADLFSFGICVQNVAGLMYWNTDSKTADILPYTIRTGLALEYGLGDDTHTTKQTSTGETEDVILPSAKYVLMSFDASITQYEKFPTFTIGAEIVPHEVIALRGGIAIAGDKQGKFLLLPMTVWGTGISIRPPIKEIPFITYIDYSVGSDVLSSSRIAHHLSLMFEF